MANEDDILIDHDKLKAHKEAEEKIFVDRQKYLDDWRVVLGTPAGRRIVWDLLGMLGYQRDMFNTDALIMARNCGQYQIVLGLIRDIEEAIPGIMFRTQNEFRSGQANKK